MAVIQCRTLNLDAIQMFKIFVSDTQRKMMKQSKNTLNAQLTYSQNFSNILLINI